MRGALTYSVVLNNYALQGWREARAAKASGATLEQAVRKWPQFKYNPGKAAAYREGWLAFERGLPMPKRERQS